MRKPFIIGVVVGIVLVMAASIAVTLPFSAPFDKACRDMPYLFVKSSVALNLS